MNSLFKWKFGMVAAAMSLILLNIQASITVEVAIGSLQNGLQADDVGILVVDVAEDGFQTPQAGIQLTEGNTIGLRDDVILAVFQAEDGAHWNGGVGFGGIASAIDLESLGISTGAPLKFYWLPGKRPGDFTSDGEPWYSFREDAVGASGGTIGFLTPDEFGVYRISQMTADLGGDFDSSDPASSGDYGADSNLAVVGNIRAVTLNTTSVRLNWDAVSGAQGYNIYRSTSSDFSSATLVGTTDDLLYADGNVPAGQFYYWVETEFPAGASLTRMTPLASTLIAVPDLTIGGTTRQLVRRWVMRSNPIGQTITIKPTGLRVGSAYSSLFNAGTGAGRFRVVGGRGNQYSKVDYFRINGPRRNITAGVRIGSYSTASLNKNQREIYQTKFTPTPKYRNLVRSGAPISRNKRVTANILRSTPKVNALGVDAVKVIAIRNL